jgi:hypothetical protein
MRASSMSAPASGAFVITATRPLGIDVDTTACDQRGSP